MTLETNTDNFYIQAVPITRRPERKLDWFLDLCRDRSVLHVGCVNSPFVEHGKSEHAKFASVASRVDGCDIDIEGLRQLKEVVAGRYFGTLQEVIAAELAYDVVVASNVLEHVANPATFLSQLFQVPAAEILIVVPNAMTFKGEYDPDLGTFREWVHRDHLCWYSPYTLLQTIQPHLTGVEKVVLHFVEAGDDQIAAYIRKGEA
jgi:2-polyprenyl-3-methyl-5-hydroxy-6-metoxy-1,4-benzoquinol methylase